jgi:hypothetical protein
MEEILVHPFLFSQTTFRWNDLNNNRNYDAGEVNLDQRGRYVSGGEAGGRRSTPTSRRQLRPIL